jgi:hypothetical protein
LIPRLDFVPNILDGQIFFNIVIIKKEKKSALKPHPESGCDRDLASGFRLQASGFRFQASGFRPQECA